MLATQTHSHMHTHCATCPVYSSSFRSKLYKVFLEQRVAENERWRREETSAGRVCKWLKRRGGVTQRVETVCHSRGPLNLDCFFYSFAQCFGFTFGVVLLCLWCSCSLTTCGNEKLHAVLSHLGAGLPHSVFALAVLADFGWLRFVFVSCSFIACIAFTRFVTH